MNPWSPWRIVCDCHRGSEAAADVSAEISVVIAVDSFVAFGVDKTEVDSGDQEPSVSFYSDPNHRRIYWAN